MTPRDRELQSTTGLDAPTSSSFSPSAIRRATRARMWFRSAYMALIPDAARIVAPSGKYATGGWFEVPRCPRSPTIMP